MKKQILSEEFERMQELAGITTESMNNINKLKELIVKAVKEFNMYEDFGYDLTEFIETVNKTDDLDKLEDYVTNYLYSKKMIDRGYEVGEFWIHIYKQVAGLI